MKTQIIWLAIAVGVCGCVSHPAQVVPDAAGAYRISVAGSLYETQADVNLRALNAAAEYCRAGAKELLFTKSTESRTPMLAPKQEDLTFACLGGADPRYMKGGLTAAREVVAKQ